MKRDNALNRDLLIDQASDKFEAMFRESASYPELDSFLDSVGSSWGDTPLDPAFRNELATEIVRLRISLMQQQGQTVDLDQLRREMPNHQHAIDAALNSCRPAKQTQSPPENEESGQAFFQRAWIEATARQFRLGDRLGSFEIQEHLGQGGMGTVWRARQTEPVKREVALKLIRSGRYDAQMLSRFRTERQAMAVLEHPHIAHMFDANQTDDGQPYLVMELVDGPRITEFADRHQLNLKQRIELFIPVCRAVQHAHQKGIIHRDLKPSNILVSNNNDHPVAKVIDFGLAKATETQLTDDSLHTQRGQVLGTPDYMSPEQTRLGQIDVDTRSDIYSLGAVLYELLTGQRPLGDHRLRELPMDEALRIVREVEPVRPSQRVLQPAHQVPLEFELTDIGSTASDMGVTRTKNRTFQNETLHKPSIDRSVWHKSLQGELDWIVGACLEKDPARRYESAAALAADLERHLAGEPVQIAPPSRSYQLKKFMAKHRGMVAALSGIFLALTAGLVATLASLNWAWAEYARAEKAAADLRISQTEVETRASELEQVASFQSGLIETIDPMLMGVTIRQEILENARAASSESPTSKTTAKSAPDSKDSETTKKHDGEKSDQQKIGGNDSPGRPDDKPNASSSVANQPQSATLSPEHQIDSLSNRLATTNFTDLAVDALRAIYFEPALKRIDNQFKDMPVVRATLLDSLAQAMAEQGALELAESVQMKSLGIWEDAVGKDDIRYWKCLWGLANIDGKNSLFPASSEKLTQVFENYRRLVGAKNAETISVASQLGFALQMNGKTEQALRLHEEVASWIENQTIVDPRFTLIAAERFAQTLDLAGRTTEAITMAKNALAAADKNDAAIQKDLISFQTHYATILNETAKVGKPIEQTMEQLFGDPNATLQGQAEANLESALEMAKLTYGEEHPVTLEINNQLGIFRTFWLDWSYGVPFFEKSLVVHERVLGRNHPQTLAVINRLGESHFHLKQYDLAIKYQQEAFEGFEKILGPDHSTTLSVKASLGINLRDKGEVKAGYEILNDVYQRGLRDSSYMFFRQQLVQTCVILNMHDRVKEVVQEQRRLSAERFEKGTFDYSTDLTFAWASLLYIGAWEDAEPILKETVEIMMRLKPDHHETFDRQSTYGECLTKLKRFDEAEPWLVKGYDGLKKLEGNLPARWEGKLSYATDRFVEFYNEQGNKELAEMWLERLKKINAKYNLEGPK